jgi:hypothetical protein
VLAVIPSHKGKRGHSNALVGRVEVWGATVRLAPDWATAVAASEIVLVEAPYPIAAAAPAWEAEPASAEPIASEAGIFRGAGVEIGTPLAEAPEVTADRVREAAEAAVPPAWDLEEEVLAAAEAASAAVAAGGGADDAEDPEAEFQEYLYEIDICEH